MEYTKQHVITHANGLHMRIAGQLSQIASTYEGEIELHDIENKKYANAVNPLNVLLLNLTHGKTVEIKVIGKEQVATLNRVAALL